MNDADLITFCEEHFSYDRSTGHVYWKKQKGAAAKGSIAGWRRDGHAQIRINKKLYPATHIIWMLVHHQKPEFVDHINHDPSDDRIENLRSVSHQENLKNMSLKKNNISGVCGVSFSKERRKWVASIRANGVQKSLGRFLKFEDAVTARKNAEIEFGFHQNHGVSHDHI